MIGFEPTPHPLLPLPSPEEVRQITSRAGGIEELIEFHRLREERIRLARVEPLSHGFEFDQWKDADNLLAENSMIYVGGGKRASKSEWAGKRFVEAALTYPDAVMWAFQDNEKTSQNTQQELVWRYLPAHIKRLNNKHNATYKVKYGAGRGFTEMFLVLPNRTRIFFLTYNQDPGDYQGWEIGARVTELARSEDGRQIQNIGAWADENLTMTWLQTIKFRMATRSSKLIWTFSPLKGITNTIKEFRGAARTVSSRPSELLPRKNVVDCPEGHMPYVQVPNTPRAAIIYFFSINNPFGGYAEIKNLLANKPSDQIKQDAYGYAEDMVGRAFPLFGSWNIVKRSELPAAGTNYMLTDPGGARNWATIWVRVTPGKDPIYYIYRDWPDMKRYGEWAVQSENPEKWDGDMGPAQRAFGYGVVEYKRTWLEEERVTPSIVNGQILEEDPYRRNLAEKALAKNGERPPYPPSLDIGSSPLAEWSTQEEIHMRLIDPRAGRNQKVAEQGGSCLIDDFADTQYDNSGQPIAEPMIFWPASGVHIEDGVTALQSLLYWDKDRPFTPLMNAPRLYVVEDCYQVIWALQNWTGADGEKGACKDFADLCRYMARSDLVHVSQSTLRARKAGSY